MNDSTFYKTDYNGKPKLIFVEHRVKWACDVREIKRLSMSPSITRWCCTTVEAYTQWCQGPLNTSRPTSIFSDNFLCDRTPQWLHGGWSALCYRQSGSVDCQPILSTYTCHAPVYCCSVIQRYIGFGFIVVGNRGYRCSECAHTHPSLRSRIPRCSWRMAERSLSW